MTHSATFQRDPKTLFGRLTDACSKEWEAYCDHEFVRGIGDATLPEGCFRHYLEQDYVFLIHFARAWALAVYKSGTLADMRPAAAVVHDILNREMQLHVRYCARWGLNEKALETIPEAKANMAYTRYVLERGLAGDVLDLHVALAPCVIGYAEIAARLAADPATKREANPYGDWIASYASEDYQQVAQERVQPLDELAAARAGQGRFASLAKTFRQATLLEIGFWDMGLHVEV
jgi:thiaminase/transcriptional activator TenA